MCPRAALSGSQRRQMYLAIRLAVADLIASEGRSPVILDDSFVPWDTPRRDNLRALLNHEANTGQILHLFYT